MRQIIGVLLMSGTFAVGFLTVASINRVAGFYDQEMTDLRKDLVPPKDNSVDDELNSGWYGLMLPNLRKGDFLETGHGCGNGFVTGYVNREHKRVSESGVAFDSHKEAQEAFLTDISKAKTILEDVRSTVRDGKHVKRAFIIGEYEGREYFEILWIDKRSQYYTSLVWPDKEVTVDLENYIIRRK